MSSVESAVENEMMNFFVERMTEHDLLEVVEIEESSGLSVWGWEAYRSELERHDSVMLVTRAHGSGRATAPAPVEGFVASRLTGAELHVNNIGVRESARGRGVGSALLRDALAWASERGAKGALLEVRANNLAAQALYRRHGFQEVGRRKNYYRDPKDDALIMTVKL